MERNREARRASMAAANGLARRRHRSNSLRDSPEEDGAVELQEPARLRDRGLKKDRDRDRDRERDRERDRDRDRSSRSKRRRADRLMHGSHREDGGDDTSEESVNDEEEDEDDDGGAMRMLPPNPAAASISSSLSNHSLQHRKSFPPAAAKVFRAAPAWKPADEMIGVSVPRKARSASTKRSHDWISGGSGVGGEQILRQASTSPVRASLVSTSTPSPAAPVSPSSSNASIRKKMKPNGTSKARPPKSSSKSSSSKSEDLEIEIAEVLYGLMTQSQGPTSKEVAASNDVKKSSCDGKSRVSSPISNPTCTVSQLTHNSTSSPSPAPVSAVAPKRKRPRQVSENQGSFSMRSSPISSTTMKVEIDQPLNMEISSPNLEKISGSENGGVQFVLPGLVNSLPLQTSLEPPLAPQTELMKLGSSASSDSKRLTDEANESRDVIPTTKEEVLSPKSESAAIRLDGDQEEATVTTATTATAPPVSDTVLETENQREEKFQIDLMAPPPQLRSSPEREGEINYVAAADSKLMVSNVDSDIKHKENDKVEKIGKDDSVNVEVQEEAKAMMEVAEQKPVGNNEFNIDLKLDLEKHDKDNSGIGSDSGNKSQHQVPKPQVHPPKATRDELHKEKTAPPSALPLPMSVASWPGGLPPMGYMAPLQGVISMDGSTMSPAPMQPVFSQPRGKRCATHCYIARNIHNLQQFMKNPFWPAAAASASLYGAKPCNLNVIPSAELHGNITGRSISSIQEKAQGLAIFPGYSGKEKGPQTANNPDSTQRKQQILLQQALPPVAPSNMLHGPAFIFPFNQQQAAVAAASVRPVSAKSSTTTGNIASSASHSSTVSAVTNAATAATAMSFNYPTISPNETQYLAILQNNAYPFPIPAVGAQPNYRGTHAQAMPLFNGFSYPSQMIHPQQLQQLQQAQAPSQSQQMQQAHQNTSSGSSSSQKHLQSQQQRPQGSSVNGGSGNGNLLNFPAPKSRSSQQPQQQQQQNPHINPPQARQLENEVGSEESPSSADSRVSRATMSVYGQNFTMPIHPQNFTMPIHAPPGLAAASSAGGSGNQNEKKHQHQQPQQHQSLKPGTESLQPQTFAMSFAHMNGSTTAHPGIDISSQLAQNHPILQSLPESTRQSYQIMAAAAAAHAAQHKKNYRIPEEGKNGGSDLSNVDEERKGLAGKAPPASGQSIAFSRPDLGDASGSAISGNNVVDSSARTLNMTSGPARTSRSPQMPTNSQLQAQLHNQQQQMMQLHKQQHQHLAGRNNKATAAVTTTNSGSGAYSEQQHITSSASMAARFPNALSSLPQNFTQTSNNSSPGQSPQWKNTARTSTSQVGSPLSSSTTSSLKTLPQQQNRTTQQSHPHPHAQISFGANQKSSAATSQGQPTNNQSPSTMMVGSPTHSSISKGASGSPRTITSGSTSNKNGQTSSLSSQQAKNSPSVSTQKSSPVGGRNVQSILGNPHITSSSTKSQLQQQLQQQQQQQQQLAKQTLQQAQLFYSNPYNMQAQAQHSANSTASASNTGYYIQRRRPEQQQQQSATASTGMLSLCPVTGASTATTSDPAKAVAAATAAAASNMKGSGILHAAQFGSQSSGNPHHLLPAGFSYVHAVPAAVQVKPAEQKQPAGSDNLHACWQPEKK